MFSRSGWSVVRRASFAKGGTSKKRPSPHLHKVPTRRNELSPRTLQTALVHTDVYYLITCIKRRRTRGCLFKVLKYEMKAKLLAPFTLLTAAFGVCLAKQYTRSFCVSQNGAQKRYKPAAPHLSHLCGPLQWDYRLSSSLLFISTPNPQ
jgi:hypothetical protein